MDRQDIENIYYNWENHLKNEYNQTFHDAEYTIFDGVISPYEYYNSPIKILFLNREPYDECSYEIHKALKEQIEQEALNIYPENEESKNVMKRQIQYIQ